MSKEVTALTVYPDFRRFLIRGIRDQVEGIASFERSQMAVPVGEGDAVYRSPEVRRAAIRKRRTVPAHSGFGVRVMVHRPWFIR